MENTLELKLMHSLRMLLQELKIDPEDLPKVGNEISSYSTGMLYALTNPTITSPSGFKWNESRLDKGWLTIFKSKPLSVFGKDYQDVEEAYQSNKSQYPIGYKRDSLMIHLIRIKFHTYPHLVTRLKSKGGIDYLKTCVHYSSRSPHWDSRHDNGFIINLIIAWHLYLIDENTLPF